MLAISVQLSTLAEFIPCIGVNPANCFFFQNHFFVNVVDVKKNVNPAECCPYRALFMICFMLIVNLFQFSTKIEKVSGITPHFSY